jgi:hypothetical protein
MAELQRRVRFVPRFRRLAMGAEPEPELLAIFGTLPSDEPPRHDETLQV